MSSSSSLSSLDSSSSSCDISLPCRQINVELPSIENIMDTNNFLLFNPLLNTDKNDNCASKNKKHATPATSEYSSFSSDNDDTEEKLSRGHHDENGHVHCINERTHLLSTPPQYSTPQRKPKHSLTITSPQDTIQSSTTIDDENTHVQSLLLALAFFSIWTPQNLMAPNLTQMATDFNFSASQRDTYLGANIAFATGVLSLPLSGVIGFLADIVPSRRDLFSLVVLLGGLSSIATGLSNTYTHLFFARFVNGGFMAGSVPIAFSLLGDLFHARDRNTASSGLTAMMGAGIVFGQVFAGIVGDVWRWEIPFYVSGVLCMVSAVGVMMFVKEPVRGGKEKVIQDILKKGGKYERKLTVQGFYTALRHNRTNILLILQGFFSGVPWGIIFVFLNDYLSQEQGMTVPDATLVVLVFGFGSAVGGIAGGYLGQWTTSINRIYMPIFMAISTVLGIIPFLALLDLPIHRVGLEGGFIAFMGGVVANLPSVNVRPIIINVNPPEVRGATLTAANLVINLARGIGPVFMTMTCGFFNVSRQFSLNVLIIIFWVITAIQLLFLATTLPYDQDKMESELAHYAKSVTSSHNVSSTYPQSPYSDDNDDLLSIEDPMSSFDAKTASETCMFLKGGRKEMMLLGEGMEGSSSDGESDEYREEADEGLLFEGNERRNVAIDVDTCL